MEGYGGSGEAGEGGLRPFHEAYERSDLGPWEKRLVVLIEEFGRRQRMRPDLVVRPWWSQGPPEPGRPRVGFVVEYCPDGQRSAELRVRGTRVTVEGPGGSAEALLRLDGDRWELDGRDAGCPETLANHLLRLADRALGEAA